jgi:hypothetical protein
MAYSRSRVEPQKASGIPIYIPDYNSSAEPPRSGFEINTRSTATESIKYRGTLSKGPRGQADPSSIAGAIAQIPGHPAGSLDRRSRGSRVMQRISRNRIRKSNQSLTR